MKIGGLKILILIALLTSVLSYSQDWQPKQIVYDNQRGVFITLDLMDTIAFKLIERKSLLSELDVTKKILGVSEAKIFELTEKSNLLNSTAKNFQLLYEKSEEQNRLHLENLDKTNLLVKAEKKRGRKKALYAFGGGLTVGVMVFALLIN